MVRSVHGGCWVPADLGHWQGHENTNQVWIPMGSGAANAAVFFLMVTSHKFPVEGKIYQMLVSPKPTVERPWHAQWL